MKPFGRLQLAVVALLALGTLAMGLSPLLLDLELLLVGVGLTAFLAGVLLHGTIDRSTREVQ